MGRTFLAPVIIVMYEGIAKRVPAGVVLELNKLLKTISKVVKKGFMLHRSTVMERHAAAMPHTGALVWCRGDS
jgi:hypothetical protein